VSALGQVVGDLLPAAVAVALNPGALAILPLLLGAPRARTTGLAFTVGWVIGLAGLCTGVALVFEEVARGDDGPSTAASWVKVVVGAAFLALAVKSWRGRPRGDEAVAPPAWLAGIESTGQRRALGLGLVLSAVNPKNLALVATAGASIGDGGLSDTEALLAILAFVVLGSGVVVGLTAFHLMAPRRAERPIAALRSFIDAHGTVLVLVVLVLLGANLLGDGLAGLA